MKIKIIERLREFVDKSKDQFAHGDKKRGWTVVILWSFVFIISIIILFIVYDILKWVGLIVLLGILFIIEIILRIVDRNSH